MSTKVKQDDPKESAEFEKLVAEKKQLWEEVRDNPKYLETEQYQRIIEIDKKLWELVKS